VQALPKSSVSRAVKGASEASLRQLMERSFKEHGAALDGFGRPI
jgi:hypothetical protein